MKSTAILGLAVLCGAILSGGGANSAGEAPGSGAVATPDAASAWTPIGPIGGEVKGLARNAKNPNELYASFGSYPSQIFKSTTGAQSWTRTLVLQENVVDLAADPKNAGIVYAYSGYRILKSSNRAASFPKIIETPKDFRGYNGRMVIHPTNPSILFITGNFVTNTSNWAYCPAVARSLNGGKTWTVIKFETTARYGDIYDIAVHPKNPSVVLAVGEHQKEDGSRKIGVYRSVNGGASYKSVVKDSVFNTSTYNRVLNLALHPTDPKTAFVSYSNNGGGVARTTNGGSTWQKQSKPAYMLVSALATDKAKPQTVYALGQINDEGYRGFWVSADGGRNWENYPSGLYGYGQRLIVNGRTMIAGTWAGIFRSRNAGLEWTSSHAGIRAARADTFAVAPSSPRTIYAEIAHYGLFKTLNGGGAWTMCPYFYRCESILKFVVHPADPKTVVMLAGG